jgi:hypothetical protein
MDIMVFGLFLFYSLISLGYAFYNKKVIYLAAVSGLFILSVLAPAMLTEGLTQTFSGTYGFLNGTASVTGAVSSSVVILSNTNIFTQAIGTFLIILGIMTFFLTFWYMLKGSSEEDED